MIVYVKKRHNGQTNVQGKKVAELPRLRQHPALIGVEFPESTLVEWFPLDQVSETPATVKPPMSSQLEMFSR